MFEMREKEGDSKAMTVLDDERAGEVEGRNDNENK